MFAMMCSQRRQEMLVARAVGEIMLCSFALIALLSSFSRHTLTPPKLPHLLPTRPPFPAADPAAEAFQYPVSFDIRDLVSLEDVVEELGLGPNGWVREARQSGGRG